MTASDADAAAVDEAALLKAARRAEREIVTRFIGGFAWPTALLFAALAATWTTVVALGISGRIPVWAGLAANTVVAYGCYTVHHEANHGNISGGDARLRWLDTLLGRLVSIPLTLSFSGFAPLHLLHHAHTNDPERDPDYLVAGPAAALPAKWALLVFVVSVTRALPIIGPRLTARLVPLPDTTTTAGRSTIEMRRFDQLALVALAAAFVLGVGVDALLLWWLPGKLSGLILMATFQWLPHHPHAETDRYRNTRINVFPMSTPALLEQDHHLMHHLFPRVPWYRYRKLFREMRPHLEECQARIEGRRLGPGVPAIALR